MTNIGIQNPLAKSPEEVETERLASLWDEARQGQREALRELFLVFGDGMLAYGLKFTSDREVVKDAIQEIFIRIADDNRLVGPTDNPKAYLLASMRREIQRQASHNPCISMDANKQLAFRIELLQMEPDSPDDDQAEALNNLHKAIRQLTPRQQEAIYLRYIQGIGMKDIGEMMDLNYQSTRNLLHRSLLHLRSLMGGDTRQLKVALFLLLYYS